MAAKTTYTATAPDGTVHTRTTSRTYTHAVLVTDRNVDCYGKDVPNWQPSGFCGSEDLADKLRARSAGWWHKVIVVPVVAR